MINIVRKSIKKERALFQLKSSLFYILLSLIFFFSCTEPKIGCLNITATNFAADADDPCEDCCIFPNLQLQFLHRVNLPDTTFNLSYGNALSIDNNNFFRISDIKYFVTDLELVRADGSTTTVSETVDLKIPNGNGDSITITRPDNFTLVSANNFQAYSIANYTESGNFVGIRFNLGIIEPDNQAVPSPLPTAHALQTDGFYLGTGQGYIFNQVSFFRDTIATDTIPVVVTLSGSTQLRTVELDFNFDIKESFNTTIVLTVDYLQWFQGVNVKNDNVEEVASKIVDNISSSFSVFAVNLN